MSSRRGLSGVRGLTGLPPHVQGILNQEKRLLQQTLEHLDREAAYNIRTVGQEQQVIAKSLQVLQTRLEMSKKRSQAVLNPPKPSEKQQPPKNERLRSKVQAEAKPPIDSKLKKKTSTSKKKKKLNMFSLDNI